MLRGVTGVHSDDVVLVAGVVYSCELASASTGLLGMKDALEEELNPKNVIYRSVGCCFVEVQ